ncbi:MAG TPA: peroxiredoxin-like family protein [bacterium]|nr:peroxiredoxin-like family protein [bacterium]
MKEKKRLIVGEVAPDFTLPALGGAKITLSERRGEKIWLAFFRYAGCPLCNLRVGEMIARHARYEQAGLTILTVWQSPLDRLVRLVDKQEPPFPLLADPREEVYGRYGLEAKLSGMFAPAVTVKLAKAAARGFFPGPTDGTKTRLPGDFLIDEQGVLRDVFYGRDIAEHIPFERVEAFI